mmetsp:Transcript_16197/g.18756  ORF Transcript_16197/g.18756 Transcript_16197/m.18756 type:complete len:372 (+) Transcript_16197:435-1550(+)
MTKKKKNVVSRWVYLVIHDSNCSNCSLGTLFFGIACKVAGVGMGTNVSMGIITIIGTFLPLITENTLISPFGGVVCIGLVICCLGLWFATKALAQRDLDERLFATQNTAAADEDKGVHNVTFPLHLKNDEGNEQNDNNINKEIESSFQSAERIITPNVNDALKTSRYLYLRRFTASFRKSTTRRNQENQQYTTFKKFCVCLLTGITAVQLQFAFIFGSPIVDLATGKVDGIVLPGATPIGGSAAIIWLLAISIGAPISILKGLWSSPVPLSSSLRAPWWRHLRLIGTTSIPWICHIHLYGLCATTLLPENIAASVGWPLLMMMTNLWAIVLSKILGEWAVASPETIKTFVHSLCVTIIGLVVLMCSVAVPT